MGKELKEDLFIYSYDIMNESTVQAMIKKWNNFPDIQGLKKKLANVLINTKNELLPKQNIN